MADPNDLNNVKTQPGGLGEQRSVGADAGVAVTTTVFVQPLPKGTAAVELIPRNSGSSALLVKYAVNPQLYVFKTTDDGVTFTDYSDNAQDDSVSTDVTLSSLGTLAQGDYLYVGAPIPFRGVRIDVDAANANASVLTVKYLNTAGAWVNITATDGTDSGGASMAVDGNVTWTVPTAWALNTLSNTNIGKKLYWTRWEVSAALDSTTTLNSLLPLNRSTAYRQLLINSLPTIFSIIPGLDRSLEFLTETGTANLIVNVFSGDGKKFR